VRGWEDIFSFFIAASNRSISSQSLSSAVNVGILNETASKYIFYQEMEKVLSHKQISIIKLARVSEVQSTNVYCFDSEKASI